FVETAGIIQSAQQNAADGDGSLALKTDKEQRGLSKLSVKAATAVVQSARPSQRKINERITKINLRLALHH
ncbi:MAG TPA: hypothetical protein PLD20_26310, partial [Blastocatellia bacterium]|nr:hypothetical protein [Blastocatellia bacterium]